MLARETSLAVLLSGAAMVLLGAGLVARVEVTGASMVPTLLPGDRVVVWKPGRWRLRAGDLVVVPDPRWGARRLVKRISSVEAGTNRVRVAGDNPAGSTDSRVFGPVATARVTGRVVYRYFPLERAGTLGRHRSRGGSGHRLR